MRRAAPFLITLFLSLTVLPPSAPADSTEPQENAPAAPDFALKNLSGDEIRLSEKLKGGPVLLDFWATWCKPCLKALSGTERLHEEYKDRGLTVLAINLDSPRSTAKVRSYVKSKGYSFEVLLDANSEMMRLYHFQSIPRMFLLDANGTIAYSQLGYTPGHEQKLAEEIEKLLAPRDGEAAGKAETDHS